MTLSKQLEKVNELTGFTRAAGVRVAFADTGEVHLSLERKPELLQFNGFFHGGVISGLADHAAGAAATTSLPPGRIAVTVDLHINFLGPADGTSIVARAKAVRSGGTICVATVEVTTEKDGTETLCAIATSTLRAVEMPRPGP